MKAKATVLILLKPEIPDVHGKAILGSLKAAGYEDIINVHSGKEITLEIEYEDKNKIPEIVDNMCRQLLAHPVSENYTYTVEFPEPEMIQPEPIPSISQIDLDEIEIKFPMGEKLIILGESKELTDFDCVFLSVLFMRYQKNGKFQEWLNRVTDQDILLRGDKVVKKVFARANKAIHKDEHGAALAVLFMTGIEELPVEG